MKKVLVVDGSPLKAIAGDKLDYSFSTIGGTVIVTSVLPGTDQAIVIKSDGSLSADAVVEAFKGKSDQVIITDKVVNVDIFSDADQLDMMLRKLDMSQPYGSFSKRREPVPTYPVGDTRQLVFGQTVKQTGPVIDTSRVTKRSKRRNRHK